MAQVTPSNLNASRVKGVPPGTTGLAMLGAEDVSAGRTVLELDTLGDMAFASSGSIGITGGAISGVTIDSVTISGASITGSTFTGSIDSLTSNIVPDNDLTYTLGANGSAFTEVYAESYRIWDPTESGYATLLCDEGQFELRTNNGNPAGLVISSLSFGNSTVTANTPILSLSQTWNNASETFSGVLTNIVDTASLSTSKFIDWQISGSSKAYIEKDGDYVSVGSYSGTRGIFTGGTVTADTPTLTSTQTWNSSGVTFNGFKLNVTDTASAAASKLIDLQVGGSSKFAVTKAGLISGGAGSNVTLDLTSGSAGRITVFSQTYDFGDSVGGFTVGNGIINLGTFPLRTESATIMQFGNDAAGTTNYVMKGPDRITSDGVGGNVTIAGGRNRGASAGGSLIFQTSPAAGAGVAGTLADRMTINGAGDIIPVLPTTEPSTSGALWNDGGVARVSDTTGSDSSQKYKRSIVSLGCRGTSPLDGTDMVFGAMLGEIAYPNTFEYNKFYFPFACRIKKAYVHVARTGVDGSSETCTLYIRKNNTTDTSVSSTIVVDAPFASYNNTNLDIAIAAGEYIEMKLTCPTFATDSTGVNISVNLEIEAE